MEYNIYCDESCHLENDGINAMGIGAVYCPTSKIHEVNDRIRDIKARNGIHRDLELKWTKISPSKIQVYEDLINYFFDDASLHFRAIIIKNKDDLDHERFKQDHNTWYYKMYFDMLQVILEPSSYYNIYIDIKDTHSYSRAQKLRDVCCNAMYDFSHKTIKKLQPIRSDEVQIMQLTDILIGAVVYHNRYFLASERRSASKLRLIDLIKSRSNYNLTRTTLLREDKFNLLFWEAR